MGVCLQCLITEVQGTCRGVTRESKEKKTKSSREISTPEPGEGKGGMSGERLSKPNKGREF